jgi:hypothetical protein
VAGFAQGGGVGLAPSSPIQGCGVGLGPLLPDPGRQAGLAQGHGAVLAQTGGIDNRITESCCSRSSVG